MLCDVLCDGHEVMVLEAPLVHTPNTHGTGAAWASGTHTLCPLHHTAPFSAPSCSPAASCNQPANAMSLPPAGCTLASAISAYLAKGMALKAAVMAGREYLHAALR